LIKKVEEATPLFSVDIKERLNVAARKDQ